MLAQEPDGTTTYSLPSNCRRRRRASGFASFQNPELKAGCPQHVWPSGKSTSTPSRRSTRTVLSPTSGKNWSTTQETNREACIYGTRPGPAGGIRTAKAGADARLR